MTDDEMLLRPFVEGEPVDSGLGFFDDSGRWVKIVIVPVGRADTAEEQDNACAS